MLEAHSAGELLRQVKKSGSHPYFNSGTQRKEQYGLFKMCVVCSEFDLWSRGMHSLW